MRTKVYETGPARFDMCGQSLPPSLHLTDMIVSHGLATRLHAYALKAMQEMGFGFVSELECVVSTLDACDAPAERAYGVTWTTHTGAEIGIEGILTNKGWPVLDHGPFIQNN